MMKLDKMFAMSLLVFVACVGCAPKEPASDSLPISADTPVDANPGEGAATDAMRADFTVEPADVHMCDGQDRVVSTVKWQVKDPMVSTVRVEVDGDANAERKVFAAGGASGESKTGDWVVAGVRFHLVDAATGKELGLHVVKGLPCK